MKQLFGGLLNYEDDSQLNKFIDDIETEEAIKFLETILRYCHQNGAFSLEESYYVYKTLKKIKNDEKSDIRDNDNHGNTN